MYNLTLIPGDGIGPSLIDIATKVIEAAGVKIEWDVRLAGMAAVEKFDSPIPYETLESIRHFHVCLKGPLTTPIGGGYRNVNVSMRQEFQLYANVRPAVSFEGVPTPFGDLDIVVIRENTEEMYSGVEHFITAEDTVIAAESTSIVTRAHSERIIRYAFEYARKNKRKKVTIVHKANILKCTTGLFLAVGKEIAKDYPDIRFEDKIVDACAMQLVTNPKAFDVIVTTNLFGDILSDLTAGLVGGLGLAAGANIGKTASVFESVHGSAHDLTGQNIANPAALILASVMMLNHIGESDAARRIEFAVRDVIKEGVFVTPDLKKGSSCTTAEMGDAVINKLISK
jgi:isocitrate dehydrogenase (NAD+)